MKKIITLLFLVIGFTGISQGKKTTVPDPMPMTKAKLATVKSLQDLGQVIKEGEACQNLELVGKVHNQVKLAASTGTEFTIDQIDILKNADVDTKIYIDYKLLGADGLLYSRTFAIKVKN